MDGVEVFVWDVQVLNVRVWECVSAVLYVTFIESGSGGGRRGLRCVSVLHKHAGMKKANHKSSPEVI